jgi:glycosyltransferase involved in cell wall biosynthesis
MIKENKKICCIFNLAPHYNAPIYKMIGENFDADFFIGDTVGYEIKTMDPNELKSFKSYLKFRKVFNDFYYQKGAIKLALKEYDTYIITGEPHCLSTWVILIICKLLGKHVYLWTHGWYGNESPVKIKIKKLFFLLSHGVLLYGDYARNIMLKLGFNSKKLKCIYNSLDYDKQVQIRKTLITKHVFQNHFGNNYPVIIYIGRLQKVKRLDLIFNALNKLKEQGFEINLVIVGQEIEDTGYSEIVQQLEIERNVWFFGPCYDEEIIGQLFFESAVCVSPGNVGLTAIHALTYGTPVITHNVFSLQMPEFEAIVEKETGAFFEIGNVDSLAEKILDWTSLNDNQRNSIRQLCYQTIDQRYNPNEQINILKSFLEFK